MANLIRWDPMGEMYSIRDTVNRFFGGHSWQPTVDVLDRENELVLRADLPGLDQKNLEVTVDEDSVTLRGEMRAENEEQEENYFRRERSFGSFTRVIPLNSLVKPEDSQASYKNGLLEVTMPKAERARPKARRLEIH